MYYITEDELSHIEKLKEEGDFGDALKIVNRILTKDPLNEEALLQVADIEYRKGEIDKASKAIDFLNTQNDHMDPMGLYIKGVLEMEKNNWIKAKKFLQEAMKLTNCENHEIIRCYGLTEYRYGNREKWVLFLEDAYKMHSLDAEVIYNLVEIYLLEHRFGGASRMIKYYYEHYEDLECFDKDMSYYDRKIQLFEKYIDLYGKRRKTKK